MLAKLINVTNVYNRKNINSSISPDDPILSQVITSKEKELILSPENLVSYINGIPSKKYKILDLLENTTTGKLFKAVNILMKNLVEIEKIKS